MAKGSPKETASVRVLIIDDHKLFGEALRSALIAHGMQVLQVATAGAEGLDLAIQQCPDVALVDLNLPDTDGVELGQKIMTACPGITVLAVTALSDPHLLREVMKAGFHGYLPKDTPMATFVESIRAAVSGQVIVPHKLTARAAGAQSEEEQNAQLLAHQLTERERAVLAMLVEGARSEAIAQRLSISPNTVRTHIQNILTKLQVHSRLEAAAFAIKHQLVDRRRERRHE